jgi:hypothetical protein
MIYLRIKHKKTTYFLNVNPTETVFRVKFLLAKLIKNKEPRELKLLLPGKGQQIPLENTQTIDQVGLVNDSFIYVIFLVDNGWESVNVPEFESLYEEDEKDKQVAT